MLEKLKKSKNNPEKNEIQINSIKSGLRDFKEELENMSKEEKETERPNQIVNIVDKILEFNRKQSWEGLKILTPHQMLNRLPISLAQLSARNNPEKLKNGVRQLLYPLYRSKKLTKHIYVWSTFLKTEIIFMNTENSKMSEPHRFKLGLTDRQT